MTFPLVAHITKSMKDYSVNGWKCWTANQNLHGTYPEQRSNDRAVFLNFQLRKRCTGVKPWLQHFLISSEAAQDWLLNITTNLILRNGRICFFVCFFFTFCLDRKTTKKIKKANNKIESKMLGYIFLNCILNTLLQTLHGVFGCCHVLCVSYIWFTCGRDSMLCPLILTTVSEELEVEELTSFTISPVENRWKHSATVWISVVAI